MAVICESIHKRPADLAHATGDSDSVHIRQDECELGKLASCDNRDDSSKEL